MTEKKRERLRLENERLHRRQVEGEIIRLQGEAEMIVACMEEARELDAAYLEKMDKEES